jgi:hypothetical protein
MSNLKKNVKKTYNMKELKNIILPITFIAFSSYFRMIHPEIKAGSFNYFWFGLTYIFAFLPIYYIACLIYPSKDNVEIPIHEIYQKWSKTIEKTKAFKISVYALLGVIAIGGLLWYNLPIKYTQNELKRYGVKTKTVISSERIIKRQGRFYTYEFKDLRGRVHSDMTDDYSVRVGDSITVWYSRKRPEINIVLLE